ncbi:hypothetical protein HYPSUDRAFT_403267 [Hypholoma sublateritium FD-334 SS-4]|uniref:Uncharacterized protein n=1 Tax=Hypholoma sublateritium (strain FD-334 SS-4) TaxID=945553 RepID=A0A0D2LDJ3_HYPSF|nr:hypothetical protein HYPSUDRAFT_403267 [Hypholoma sublateritium FD-334 SS-4]
MSTTLSTPTTSHATPHPGPAAHPAAHTQQQQQQQQQQPHQPPHGPPHGPPAAPTPQHPPHAPATHLAPLALNITKNTLCEAFLQGVDASTLANMVTNFAAAHPSPTPLTAVVDALFDAIAGDGAPAAFTRDPHPYLRRFLDASAYFSGAIVHAGVAGPLAGPRALQMQIRKYSTWTPTTPLRPTTQQRVPAGPATSSASSLSDEMHRIATDRQRRKDHIQWARIHAAALEVGVLGMGRVGDADNSGYAYAMGRAFSEMMARDAVWEPDEVEWVAGICVLRAVIRTAMRGDRRQRDEYDELLRTYEGRWKEIKDEARQTIVTEVLLSAKDDLARLDESIS